MPTFKFKNSLAAGALAAIGASVCCVVPLVPGGIAQPFQGTAQRKQSKIEDGRQDASAIGAQSLTARTPWHDEGNSKPPIPPTRARTHPIRRSRFGDFRGAKRSATGIACRVFPRMQAQRAAP